MASAAVSEQAAGRSRERTGGHRVRRKRVELYPPRVIDLVFDAVVTVGWPWLGTVYPGGDRKDVKWQRWNGLPRMDFAWLGVNLTTLSFAELAEELFISTATARMDFRLASYSGWTEKRVEEAEWVQREYPGGLLWAPF